MKKEIDDSIIELTINDLDKCVSFWDIPSKLSESINSGKRKGFAYEFDITHEKIAMIKTI